MTGFTISRGVASSVGSPTVSAVEAWSYSPHREARPSATGHREESLLLPRSTSPGYCLLRVGKRPACMAG